MEKAIVLNTGGRSEEVLHEALQRAEGLNSILRAEPSCNLSKAYRVRGRAAGGDRMIQHRQMGE